MQAYVTMMVVRLLDVKRILKPTGSIYLHCDPTASHYLKLAMDCILGASSFRSELKWKRTNAKGLARANYPANADTILYYAQAQGRSCTWNPQYRPLEREYVESHHTKVEPETGHRYRLDNLLNPNRDRPNLTYEFLGVTRVWRWSQKRMQAAYEKGLIVQTKAGGTPQLHAVHAAAEQLRDGYRAEEMDDEPLPRSGALGGVQVAEEPEVGPQEHRGHGSGAGGQENLAREGHAAIVAARRGAALPDKCRAG